MNETKKRIEAYKASLPDLRERVIAVALLLAMSLAMVTSASFAWFTLSRAPQLTGVNTTVASNGNLEIALVKPDGSLPAESAIGDSSAAKGQSVVGSNITWGNLVNLSDPSYGLDHLTLRPAQLNQSALLTSPLFGAVYSEDGRVEKLNSSFAYATWKNVENTSEYRFLVSNEYGIRAITSTTVEAVGFAQQVLEKQEAAETANLQAGSDYLAITQKKNWMDSLAVIMGQYLTARLNDNNPVIQKENVINMRDMFAAFIDVYEQQIVAMVNLTNYQLFLLHNSESGSTPYTNYTVDTLLATTEANLLKEGIQLTGLNQLKTDYGKLQTHYATLVTLSEQGTVYYNDMSPILNGFVNVGTCTVGGIAINSLASNVGSALGMLNGSTQEAIITNGILWNFERLNGTRCDVKNLKITASMSFISVDIKANVSTNAPTPAQFSVNQQYADGLNQGAQGVEVAQDTYGLAIDLWVRTNAPDSYLTLEGNVLTNTEIVDATTTSAAGDTVLVYTIAVEDEEGNSYSVDIYKIETEGTATWYYADNHAEVAAEILENTVPIQKKDEIVTVIGFEGENRVWEDNSMLSVNSTTQGSGSSYVYYADTPEDQARSLELLKAMNVAFVDEKGQLMATAIMDTEHFFAENGRVTVPLVLSSDAIDLGTDINGKNTYAITELEQNVAKRITAIVYLDGTMLGNEDVLAASDIQGRLNIQFGSSQTLMHAKDEALMNATRAVSASLSANSFSYDQAVESGTPMSTTVTIRVDGDEPENVTAFFLRAISSTQGSREETMTFTNNGNGTWTANYTFTAPGNYVLRSVDLDGTTYDLTEPQNVLVEGFTVESLTCDQANTDNHISIMTANSSSNVNLRLKFASSKAEAMPTSVQGRFLRQDGTAVNIAFTYNATSGFWEGAARFVTSGDYTLQYLVLDGEYTELNASMWQTATVFLGMKVAVYTDSPTNFLYLGESMDDNMQNLYMKVKIMDNTDEEMPALSGATLYYSMQGNSIAEKGMTAPLTWNATSGYYECTFKSKVGMYNFSTVTVNGNTISYATAAPSFRIMSPEPPTFNSGNTTAYQFVPGNNAVLSVRIDDCEAAVVWADITDEDGHPYSVEGYLDDNGSWVFAVPKDGEGRQDGVWTIQQLRLWDVYDKNGNPYTEESPLVFDLTNEANVTAKVVSVVTAEFVENKSQNFTGNGFMAPYTVSGLYVDICDFAGEAVELADGTSLITDVKLTLEYVNGTSATYGGYTSDGLTNATTGAVIEIPLVDDGTGTRFVQQSNATMLYAGQYTTKLSYRVQGTLVEYTSTARDPLANIPVFTASTASPTVTVTAISPGEGSSHRLYTGTIGSDGSVSVDGMLSGDFYRYSDYNATVYIYGGDNNAYNTYAPTVTLKLSGMPSSFTANMTFGNNANSSYAATYTFTANDQTKSNSIGHAENGSWIVVELAKPKIFPAGKQTVDQIEVVYNSMTFQVDLSHAVTINQPQYPPYVDFVINNDSYSGNVPARVYSEDGETVTITLPGANDVTTSWTEAKTESTRNTSNSSTDSKTVYETWTSGCDSFYQEYTKTVVTSSGEGSDSSWTRTWKITGWKVGNTTYAFGETVTVTENQTVSAVISYTDGARTTNAYTFTRTETYYTAGTNNIEGTPPSGAEIVDGSYADGYPQSNPLVQETKTPKN